MLVTFILALILLAIAVIDALTLRIPDKLSLPLILAGLVIAGLAGPEILIASAVGALAGFATFWASS